MNALLFDQTKAMSDANYAFHLIVTFSYKYIAPNSKNLCRQLKLTKEKKK